MILFRYSPNHMVYNAYTYFNQKHGALSFRYFCRILLEQVDFPCDEQLAKLGPTPELTCFSADVISHLLAPCSQRFVTRIELSPTEYQYLEDHREETNGSLCAVLDKVLLLGFYYIYGDIL